MQEMPLTTNEDTVEPALYQWYCWRTVLDCSLPVRRTGYNVFSVRLHEKHPSPIPFTFVEPHPVLRCSLPPHRADITPGHFAEAKEEPLPDHLWELVLGKGNKTECLVETDELKG